ncbi:MAG: thioesterase family protein [Acidobacteriota bacterium]
MGFEIRERVRWSDVDAAGIICYGAYTRFLEAAETELFRAAGYPYGTLVERLGVWLPRVHMSLDFENPAYLDDLLTVAAWVDRIGGRSIALSFETRREPAPGILMRGRLVFAAIDVEHRKPAPVPAGLAAALAPFLRERAPRPGDPVAALCPDLDAILDVRPDPAVAAAVAADLIHARLGPRATRVTVDRPPVDARRGSRGLAAHRFCVEISREGPVLGRIDVDADAPLSAETRDILTAAASRLGRALPRG